MRDLHHVFYSCMGWPTQFPVTASYAAPMIIPKSLGNVWRLVVYMKFGRKFYLLYSYEAWKKSYLYIRMKMGWKVYIYLSRLRRKFNWKVNTLIIDCRWYNILENSSRKIYEKQFIFYIIDYLICVFSLLFEIYLKWHLAETFECHLNENIEFLFHLCI